MERKSGKLAYLFYRTLTYSLTPLIKLHLKWRKFRGLEHPIRWPERLGKPSRPRPVGPLVWFHAVSLGESMAAIPVIKRCLERRPDVNILMTTSTLSAFKVIENWLPGGVMYEFAPLDIPVAVDVFLGHWKPDAIVLMESELWPNLVMGASGHGIILALVNARMSEKSFYSWSGRLVMPLISLLLSKFSLIAPLVHFSLSPSLSLYIYVCIYMFLSLIVGLLNLLLCYKSNVQAIRFQLLQAPPNVISFCGDLKYVTEEFNISNRHSRSIKDLQVQLTFRKIWMASSIHPGEEEVMLGVHKLLKQAHPDIVTILVPRHPQHGRKIALKLKKEGVGVALRSRGDNITPGTSIYIVDTLGELRDLYKLTPIAIIGGSFFPNLTGHNISEAAAAGCAILTGRHVGHFTHMVQKMQLIDPASVIQVSGKEELKIALSHLLNHQSVLETHRSAARKAIHGLSSGIVENVWIKLDNHVLENI